MTRWPAGVGVTRWRAGIAAIAVAVVAATAVPDRAAGAAPAGYCADASGVTVIVDFQELGGGTVIRCASGAQATGLAALKNAGFQVTGTNRWGEAFICRIEGRPGPASESCVDTPPATAYWSYWHAPNGGRWTYSQLGVMNRKPPPGSFEGWSFAKDRTSTGAPPPGAAPVRPGAATTPANPKPPAPQPPAPPPPAPGSTGGRDPAPPTPDQPATGSPGSSVDTGSGAGTGAADPVPSDVDVAERAVTSRGSPVGTLAGVAVILVLAAMAAVVVRRRRSGG